MKFACLLRITKKPQQFGKLLNRAKVPEFAQISLEMALILGIIHLLTRLAIVVRHGCPSNAFAVRPLSGRIVFRNFGDGL